MVKGLKKGARFKRASTQSIKKVKGTWEISSTDYKVHDAKREEGLYYNEIKELQLGLTEYKGSDGFVLMITVSSLLALSVDKINEVIVCAVDL